MRITTPVIGAFGLVVWTACGASDGGVPGEWAGSMDTLATGHVVVRNPETPLWPAGREWRVVEEVRIGSLEGEGPDLFGRIVSLAVDPAGRVWVFDSQVQELRVFGLDGAHVRTIGRRGGGPGEFAQAVRVELGPDGNMWVMDPQNNRFSVFDTAGVLIGEHHAPGGFIILPWPGGFDAAGNYYGPLPVVGEEGLRIVLVRYDTAFTPADTIERPRDPIERDVFEIRSGGLTRAAAHVPFQGDLETRLSARGTTWALLTDEYRLFEVDADGDTLRTITRPFTPLPVTAADRERARDELAWFTERGGRIDLSLLPGTKPAAVGFFLDDEGDIWVERVTDPAEAGRVHDVFDPEGRFLGTVTLPFPLAGTPFPIVRDGMLYGVTEDELGVQYVVRARIEKS